MNDRFSVGSLFRRSRLIQEPICAAYAVMGRGVSARACCVGRRCLVSDPRNFADQRFIVRVRRVGSILRAALVAAGTGARAALVAALFGLPQGQHTERERGTRGGCRRQGRCRRSKRGKVDECGLGCACPLSLPRAAGLVRTSVARHLCFPACPLLCSSLRLTLFPSCANGISSSLSAIVGERRRKGCGWAHHSAGMSFQAHDSGHARKPRCRGHERGRGDETAAAWRVGERWMRSQHNSSSAKPSRTREPHRSPDQPAAVRRAKSAVTASEPGSSTHSCSQARAALDAAFAGEPLARVCASPQDLSASPQGRCCDPCEISQTQRCSASTIAA